MLRDELNRAYALVKRIDPATPDRREYNLEHVGNISRIIQAAQAVDEAFSRDAPLVLAESGYVLERKLEAMREALDALARRREDAETERRTR